MKTTRITRGCGGVLVAIVMAGAEAAGAAEAPKAVALPPLRVLAPRAAKPPVIDGVMAPGEWDNAVSWSAGGWHFVDVRQVEFFVQWDADNVYVCQRATFLPGERMIRLGREPKPDVVSAMETEFEVYIDAGTLGSHHMPATYQVMGNALGNLWDMEKQYTIGILNSGWNGKWVYAQQVTPDKKYWVTELAIPRTTIYQNEPLKDGLTWKMGFGRDGGRIPNGVFGCVAPVTFKDTCPVFHLSGVERCVANKMAFALRVANPGPAPFAGKLIARMTKGSQAVEERAIAVTPGKAETITVDKPAGLKQGETTPFSIEVRQGDDLVFCWTKPVLCDDLQTRTAYLTPPEVKPFEATARFNPVQHFLRISVDRYEYAKKDLAVACHFEVKAKGAGKVLATGKVEGFRYDLATGKIALPADLAPGEYDVTATLLDAAGQSMEKAALTFTKKDLAREFPWYNNTIGVSDRVLWPFEPMTTQGNVMRPWGREIRVNGLALPAGIVTVGRTLLSGPVQIVGEAGGQPFAVAGAAAPTCLKASTTMAEFSGAGRGGPIKVAGLLHMDYDGCARIELKLEPAAGTAVELDKLAIEMPFHAEQATHLHTFRIDMRTSCYAGRMPPGAGRVWDSTRVPVNQMTVGSFVPLIYLGTPAGGVTWFADSDQGWWPTDVCPGLEILRRDGQVALRMNLAGEKATLDAPRKIVFGLHVSPVRPLVSNTWTPGSGICGLYEYDGRFDRKTQTRGFYFYPAHPDQFETYYRERFGGIPMGIYTEDYSTDVPVEDAEYFADIWTGGREKTISDCGLYYAKKLLTDCPTIHGFYIDNICPHLTENVEAGSAYALPDGRVQPGFDIWEHRDYVRRLRTLLQDMRREPHGIEVHMTKTMVIPIYAWSDSMREGENPVEADNGRKDFADLYPPDFSAIMNSPHPWGVRSVHHWMFYTRLDLFEAMGPGALWRAERTGIGHLAVHDNLFPQPSGNECIKLIAQYDAGYATAPGPERVIPYWDAQGLFTVSATNVLTSVRQKPDRLAVWVMNYARQEQEVTVWLDLPRLLSTTADTRKSVYAVDMETAEPADLLRPTLQSGAPYPERCNLLKLKLPPRDFKLVLIGAQ